VSEAQVIREDREGVATLLLNRPKVHNALSPSTFVELRRHLESLAEEVETVGCVIIRGAGSSFSAGNDLKAIERGEQAPSPTYQSETIGAIDTLPQPVLASVRGYCLTGALELVLACDLLVVSETAQFADTHAKWGMAPDSGMSQRLPRRVGGPVAREMMFAGRTLAGAECVTLGLANYCVPDSELEQATWDLAQRCLGNSWWSLRTSKRLLRASEELPLSKGLELERQGIHLAPDASHRIAAFSKGRRDVTPPRSPSDV
jgi:enoyl-CoA hydratase/carnithine racemase